mgnify:CR=1 FL=1
MVERQVTDSKMWQLAEGYYVTVEYSDLETGFAWRLIDSDGAKTEWELFYNGVSWLEGKRGIVGYLTEYFQDDRDLVGKPFFAVYGIQVMTAAA